MEVQKREFASDGDEETHSLLINDAQQQRDERVPPLIVVWIMRIGPSWFSLLALCCGFLAGESGPVVSGVLACLAKADLSSISQVVLYGLVFCAQFVGWLHWWVDARSDDSQLLRCFRGQQRPKSFLFWGLVLLLPLTCTVVTDVKGAITEEAKILGYDSSSLMYRLLLSGVLLQDVIHIVMQWFFLHAQVAILDELLRQMMALEDVLEDEGEERFVVDLSRAEAQAAETLGVVVLLVAPYVVGFVLTFLFTWTALLNPSPGDVFGSVFLLSYSVLMTGMAAIPPSYYAQRLIRWRLRIRFLTGSKGSTRGAFLRGSTAFSPMHVFGMDLSFSSLANLASGIFFVTLVVLWNGTK